MSEKRPEPAPTCLLCGESGRDACQCDRERRRLRGPTNEHGYDGADEYDPFAFVPERISPITAHGLAWLDEQLHEENTARLRSLPTEGQATVLAGRMEIGAIGVRTSVVQDLLDFGAIRVIDTDSDREEADR